MIDNRASAAARTQLVVLTGSTAAAESQRADQPLQELSTANGNIEEVEEQAVQKAGSDGPQSQGAANSTQSVDDKPAALFAKAGHEVISVIASGHSDNEDDGADLSNKTHSYTITSTPYEELD